MDFSLVDLHSLLGDLSELESDWMDERATGVIAYLAKIIPQIRSENRILTAEEFAVHLKTDGAFLDVCRLFMGSARKRPPTKLRLNCLRLIPRGQRFAEWPEVTLSVWPKD